jgi:RHS repeat-associated protein
VCSGTSATCTVAAFDHALVIANFRAAPAPVLQYYHVDVLGSVRAVTDASGTVLERHDYRPFGEDNQVLPAPGANSARFLGQQRDQTKLDYFGARYFDMHVGRFTGVDPLLSPSAQMRPQKFNRYSYAENNPLRFSDTAGLDDGLALPDSDKPVHWDTGLAQSYNLYARSNAVCMDWDDECGMAGFDAWSDNYITDHMLGQDAVDNQGETSLTRKSRCCLTRHGKRRYSTTFKHTTRARPCLPAL